MKHFVYVVGGICLIVITVFLFSCGMYLMEQIHALAVDRNPICEQTEIQSNDVFGFEKQTYFCNQFLKGE